MIQVFVMKKLGAPNMFFPMLQLLLCPAVLGAWTQHSMSYGGATRTYHVYVPSGTITGLYVFLHGQYGTFDLYSAGWNVAANADTAGFIGVIPIGTPASSGHEWNVNNPSGSNEVTFVQNVIAEVVAANSISASLPKIAMGFSNGAALAGMMGCVQTGAIYAASVAVHIRSDADFPSTCGANVPTSDGGGGGSKRRRLSSACMSEWYGVGDQDVFISSLTPTPAEGIQAQFTSVRDTMGCPSEAWTVTNGDGITCYDYANCADLGQLCIIPGLAHDENDVARFSKQTMPAWNYLTGAGTTYGCSGAGNANSGTANSGTANSGTANSGTANSGNANPGNANSGSADGGGGWIWAVVGVGGFLLAAVALFLYCKKKPATSAKPTSGVAAVSASAI